MYQQENQVIQYTISDDTGDAYATVYRLFPGVEAAFVSVHMARFDFGVLDQGRKSRHACIHYCREGRLEQEVDREFFYLMPGDCSVAMEDRERKQFRLPLGHYHGIVIGIDPETVGEPMKSYLESCGCPPWESLAHICGGRSHIVLRSSEIAGKYFESLYDGEEDQRLEYLRVRIPELFLRMKQAKTDRSYFDRSFVPRSQVELVKAVSEYITRNLNGKITVKDLTREFGISDTALQKAFRSVYGMPVISFIRAQKMQSAAQMLIRTDRTIEEIASEFGYENESKFSAAFKRIMGDPPGVYRREHSKIKIL